MLNPIRPTYKALRGGAQARNHKFDIIPAPVRGLDVSQPLSHQDPKAALFLQNYITRRAGPETRGGFRRHTTNLGGVGTEADILSLMAYHPPRGPGSAALAKLWAGGDDQKLYDVTTQTAEGVTPAAAVTVGGAQAEPGEWSHVNFSTAGVNYLCVVCANNGAFSYWTYDDAGGWVNRTANVTGTGGAVNGFDFVMAWKNRLWFLSENSNIAWFLPVGAIQGAASQFDFGPLLAHGGELRCMSSWTLDAGDGVDDKLIIVGSMGDVLIYGGTDPTSSATFGLIGRWYIGRTPAGRRFMTKYGGDVAILCENGVEYASRMLSSRGLMDPNVEDTGVANRYNEVIGADIRDNGENRGWQILMVPSESVALVTTDRGEYVSGFQYCYSTIPTAWSQFKGMPMRSAEFFDGELFFGTSNGRIGRAFSADSDDQLTDGTPGADVEAELQTSFVAPSDDSMSLKRPQLIMPMFTSTAAPSVKAQVNTEWSAQAALGIPAFTPNQSSLWNQGLWNQAVWGGGQRTFLVWLGAEGLGTHMSLRLALKAKPRTLFTSWKIVYEPGGIM